jgi:hypothetical protein
MFFLLLPLTVFRYHSFIINESSLKNVLNIPLKLKFHINIFNHPDFYN